MSAYTGPEIITDGLVLCLDASNTKSYPGSGNTWVDLSGNRNNINSNNTPYSTFGSGSFNFSNNIMVANSLSLRAGGLGAGLIKTTYYDYHNEDPNWFATATVIPYQFGLNPPIEIQTSIITESFYDDYDYFSCQWLGYFRPTTSQTYTFYLSSDDGSYMWLGANAVSGFTTNNALINNGGGHGYTEVQGSIALTAGVYYPIRIQFGEMEGEDSLTLEYSTSTISKTNNFANLIFYDIPTSIFGADSFTVNFWMYPTGWGEGRSDGIVGQKSNDDTSGWVIFNDGGAPTKINARLTSNINFLSSSNVVNNVWQNWTLVRNSSNSSLQWYLNGKLDTTVSRAPAYITDTANFYIGYSETWAGRFRGNISNIQIHNIALTANQISQNYNAYRTRYENHFLTKVNSITPGLICALDPANIDSWPGTSGNALQDLTGRGYNFTATASDFAVYNGQNVLRLDGNIARRAITGLNITLPYTILGVSRYNGLGANRRARTISSNSINWLMNHWKNNKSRHYAGGWITVNTELNNADNNWQIGIVTGATGDYRAYFDGVADSSITPAAGVSTPGAIVFGGNSNFDNEPSNCDIGLFLVWNRVLTQTEIAAIYNIVRQRFT